ncbi:MAG TPA: competence protein ComEA [Chloroflexi bacterium]|nr:competence protein ComEA [Chloroflexota bacterium]
MNQSTQQQSKKESRPDLFYLALAVLFGFGVGGLILILNKRPKLEPIQILPTTTPVLMAVHVSGAVQKPGVIYVARDTRIGEVIDEAGGFSVDADQDSLNLAAYVYDGQRIHVPSLTEVSVQPLEDQDESFSYPININHCSVDDLISLPGIGETKAAAIIKYREANGGFTTVEDILNVSGIGPSIFSDIKELITVK